MLYKVEVRTPRGDLLTLQIDDISDGYIFAEITGLDPVKASIVSTKFAQVRGAAYQGSTVPERNITLKLEYDKFADDPIAILRRRLYPYFMPQQEISLRLYMEDGLTVDIDGVVEGMESPMSTEDPEADISIICTDPDFIAIAPTVVTGLMTSDTVGRTVAYDGTASVGMVFTVNVAAPTSDITFYQTAPNGDLYSMEFAGSLLAGDVLSISTVPGDKYVTLTRSGVDTSALYGISPQSKWLQLEHGDNIFRVYATGTGSPASITFTSRYGGL